MLVYSLHTIVYMIVYSLHTIVYMLVYSLHTIVYMLVYSWLSCSSLSSQIVLMGEIMEVSESATSVTYKIDDRTGPWVDVRRWLEQV